MAHVISATTKFNHTGGVARAKSRAAKKPVGRVAAALRVDGAAIGRYYKLLEAAASLIVEARNKLRSGDAQQALEFAYWAGLRLAGARVAVSPVDKRRRKPASAWEQLALVNKSGEQWAQLFQPYSRLSREIGLGFNPEVSQLQVHALLKLVEELRAEVSVAVPEQYDAA